MEERNSELNGFVKGILVGGLLGAGLAIFFAPKSGEETRKIVRDEIDDLMTKGKEFTDKFREKAEMMKKKAEECKENFHHKKEI